MVQYGFYYDNTRCTGCKTCVMACKDYKNTALHVAYRKVYDVEGGEWKDQGDGSYTTDCFLYHLSISCNHCDDPACVKVCPTTAMHKDPETGLVLVDKDKCIGCGYCVMACPYNAPKVDRDLGYSVKCDGCKDRVAEGKQPMCVTSCPLRALDFGPIEQLKKDHPGGTDQLYPMPDPSITHPNIVIKPSPAADSPAAETGRVANPKEVE